MVVRAREFATAQIFQNILDVHVRRILVLQQTRIQPFGVDLTQQQQKESTSLRGFFNASFTLGHTYTVAGARTFVCD